MTPPPDQRTRLLAALARLLTFDRAVEIGRGKAAHGDVVHRLWLDCWEASGVGVDDDEAGAVRRLEGVFGVKEDDAP